MRANFVEPVVESIVEVLSTMAQIEALPGDPVEKTENTAMGNITGIIAMEGDSTKGSMAISFTEPVIVDVARRMLQEEISGADDAAKDLTGEITNMVMGGAKGKFSQIGIEFGMTQPRVVSGNNHIIEHRVPGHVTLLPFTTNSGQFFIEICVME